MAIIGQAITPNMAILVIMGIMVQPIMARSLTFMNVPGKYGEIGYEKNSSYAILWPKQKNVRKNGHFRVISL